MAEIMFIASAFIAALILYICTTNRSIRKMGRKW